MKALYPAARRTVTHFGSSTRTSIVPEARAVAERTLLKGGFIVSLKAPAKLNHKTNPHGEAYDQYGVPVKGGFLNVHIYEMASCQRSGSRLWAEAEVWQKTMEDGEQFMYLDIHPTSQRLTHELKVYYDAHQLPREIAEDVTIFRCPGTLQGIIIFTPRKLTDNAT